MTDTGRFSEEAEQRLHRKAYWLVHAYLEQKEVCEQCRKELESLPKITWQDAVDSLIGGGSQFTERVQTSNISDPTAKAALNVEQEMVRMEREMRAEFEKPLREAEYNVSVLESVFTRVELLSKVDAGYRDTFAFVLQFCKQNIPLEQVNDHAGKRMSRYRAKSEMMKVVDFIAEELMRRWGGAEGEPKSKADE